MYQLRRQRDHGKAVLVQLLLEFRAERAFFEFAGAAECPRHAVWPLAADVTQTSSFGQTDARAKSRTAQDAHRAAVPVFRTVSHRTGRPGRFDEHITDEPIPAVRAALVMHQRDDRAQAARAAALGSGLLVLCKCH